MKEKLKLHIIFETFLVINIKQHTCCFPWPLAASSLCQVTDNQVEAALAGAEESGRWSSEVKARGWLDSAQRQRMDLLAGSCL